MLLKLLPKESGHRIVEVNHQEWEGQPTAQRILESFIFNEIVDDSTVVALHTTLLKGKIPLTLAHRDRLITCCEAEGSRYSLNTIIEVTEYTEEEGPTWTPEGRELMLQPRSYEARCIACIKNGNITGPYGALETMEKMERCGDLLSKPVYVSLVNACLYLLLLQPRAVSDSLGRAMQLNGVTADLVSTEIAHKIIKRLASDNFMGSQPLDEAMFLTELTTGKGTNGLFSKDVDDRSLFEPMIVGFPSHLSFACVRAMEDGLRVRC